MAEARGIRRVIAQAEARELAALARYLGSDTTIDDARVLEVAAVFTISENAARARLELAVALTTRLHGTWEALRDGRIDGYKARAIAEATEELTAEQAAAVETRVLPKAPGQAPARLREALRRAVLRVDADAAEKRRQAKRTHRTVREYPTGDGAGALEIHGDAIRTQAAYQRIRAIAEKLPADGRTLDQRCSDVALDLLAGKDFDHVQVHVQLTLPATTALGVDDKPGYVAGYGDVTAQTALELAAQRDATWRRILHDPATGEVLDVGRRRYRPPASLADHVKASIRSCTAPGCIRPAHTCDLDHVRPFPQGPTSVDNLGPACRHHHNCKSSGRWTVKQAAPNTYIWTGPSGFQFTYTAEPIGDPEPPGAPPDGETPPF